MEHGSKRSVIKKHRRKRRSIIAAYVSGKLPLCQIMHPSRMSSKSRRQLTNLLNSNESKYYTKLRRVVPNRLKRPPLRDYIRGIVPVSDMLAPKKISDIPAKRKELDRIVEQQNFGTPSTPYNMFSDRNRTSSVRSIEKKAKLMLEVSNNWKLVLCDRCQHTETTPNTSRISNSRLSNWSSKKESNSTQNTDYYNTSQSMSTVTGESIKLSHDTGDMKPGKLICAEYDSKKVQDCSEGLAECGRTEKSKASRIQEHTTPPNTITRRNSQSVKLFEKEYFTQILKKHEYIEQRLIRQIIHLRKDRDKYKNAYNDLIKIHQILAERWFQFREISVD